MKRLFFVYLIFAMSAIISCYGKEEIMKNEETLLMSSDSEYIAALIFSIEDTQKTMVLHCCSGEIVVKIAPKNIDELPIIKTRSESGGNWIKYGEVCSGIAAAKAIKAIEKKYGGKCYELRVEPTENGCKILYHRAC